jgi:hypothetical protein
MDFDFNIKNYKTNELEDIFELPKGYSPAILNSREIKLKQGILTNAKVKGDNKNKLLAFVAEAKNKILEEFSKNSNKIDTLKKTYDNIYNLNKSLKPSNVTSDGGTFIIEKPSTPFGQSKPSEFYEGVLNPLSNRILRKNLNIDTRFRDNYYDTQSSNFHLNLPIRLTQVVSLQLSALELPRTFYTVSKIFGNNYFCIIIQNEKVVVIIPDGDYTATALEEYLNNVMQSYASSSDANLALLQYIYFTVDAYTGSNNGSGRMIVGINESYQNNNPFAFSLKFNVDINGEEDRINPLPLKFGWLMGFRESMYVNNVDYVSEGIVDLAGPRYIYLVVDDFNNNVNDGFIGAFNSSLLNKNILARISLQGGVNLFSYASQNNLSLITYARQYFGPVDILKLQIQLIDEYGRVLDLNNMDYSFCLTFQTVYDL